MQWLSHHIKYPVLLSNALRQTKAIRKQTNRRQTRHKLTPPSTSGQSINYLIEAAYSEVDDTPIVLPYYNSANPSVAFSGPLGGGASQNTARRGKIVLKAKAGTSAATGSQSTPPVDNGNIPLYVVTVANGATQITSGQIALASGSPFLTKLQNANEELVYAITQAGLTPSSNDGTQLWQAINARLANVTLLTTNTTFYVNASTGNDSNSGLASSSAFATIQGAINTISTRYIATQGVTIQIANGTYSGFNINTSMISSWTITGNIASPASVTVSAATAAINTGRACQIFSTQVKISGILFTAYYECINSNGSVVYIQNCSAAGLSSSSSAVGSYNSSSVQFIGNFNLSGNFYAAFGCGQNSLIAFGYGGYPPNSATIAITAATNVTFFALAYQMSIIIFTSSQLTITGAASVTGSKYLSQLNSTIQTNGAGASYLPGSTAGVTATGGQYA